jgi:hypothetical protein
MFTLVLGAGAGYTSITSLHLMGEKDPYFKDSQSLSNRLFENDNKKEIIFKASNSL